MNDLRERVARAIFEAREGRSYIGTAGIIAEAEWHPLCEEALRQADAAIAAGVGAVPAGWKLVPIEPTFAMKRASRLVTELPKAIVISRVTQWGINAWGAMLDAAPTPPAPPETGEAETAPANTENPNA